MPSKSSSPASSAKINPGESEGGLKFTGIGVSAGIVIGPALLIGRAFPQVTEREISPADVEPEIARFREAVALSQRQLQDLKHRVKDVLGDQETGILDAHQLLLDDKAILDDVQAQIRSQRRNSDFIFLQIMARHMKALQSVEDPYIRDRLADVRDVTARVLRNIQGEKTTDLAHLDAPHIVIAHDLSPSETAAMNRSHVMGFATCIGSRTSHTAIMARSLGIPAVVGVCDALQGLKSGDEVILDGYRGVLLGRPSAVEREEYQQRLRSQEAWFRTVEADAALPAETIDGFRVQLAANIELADEVTAIKRSHGVGIGLFRTEYLFVNESGLPDEEKQFEAYRRVAEEIYPNSVIIRTLDIGGDKFVSHLNLPSELNPFLGVRAIRFCLSRPDIFLCQLRAILRASAFGKIRIMFPMIATVEELQASLEYLKQARKELDAKGIPYNHHMDIGIMVEIPSAALLADRLAPHVDFFSIGTNDLIQYALAADRSNPAIAYLYQPTHPAIIRLLREVMHAGSSHGIWVSLCGEMASEPLLAPLLLGIGIQEFSMSLSSIGPIKRLIRRMRMHEAEELVQAALRCSTAGEVRKRCEQYVRSVAPDALGE